MSQDRVLASFCRLCLNKTKDKVPVFGKDEVNMIQLLMLIELDIDPDQEPDAILCFDCVVTLEGFFQFKEQCHENDEYLKTLPVEDCVEASDVIEVDTDFLVEVDLSRNTVDSEEEGLVEDYDFHEQTPSPEKPVPVKSPEKQTPRPKRQKLDNGSSSKIPELKQVVARDKANKIVLKPVNVKRYDTPAVLDPNEIERECAELNIRKREMEGPSIAELQVLRDSYPDYFYFEKGPRSLYFTLVFYGERFHSATYSDRYTYWKCIHKRKFRCKALVVCTNDYAEFERRYEHSHGELEEKEGLVQYTPRQALPALFQICRWFVEQRHARRRKQLLERKKLRLESGEDLVVEEEIELNSENGSDPLTKVLASSGILESSDEDSED